MCVISKGQNAGNTNPNAPSKPSGQTENSWEEPDQTDPTYPGGINELYKYLNKNIVYPKGDLQKRVQGRVLIQFVVEKDGSLGDIKAVRPASTAMADECIRVFKDLKFIPGTLSGKAVRVQYVIPLVFEVDHPTEHQPRKAS